MNMPIEIDKNDMMNISMGVIVIFSTIMLTMFLTEGPLMTEINSFEDCVDAGFPVMESYPMQCRTPEGRTFVEMVEFYGSSTNGSCEASSECIVGGCNSEICQAESEEMLMSICIEPDKPLPSDLGYNCKCVENACKWD